LGHFFLLTRLKLVRLILGMDLKDYFNSLIKRLEESDIQNNGKDRNGFFEPTREMLFQRLSILRDLHLKPNAKPMLRTAWEYVVDHVPPEWLILNDQLKQDLKKMLA
jgi:hypothetical protein